MVWFGMLATVGEFGCGAGITEVGQPGAPRIREGRSGYSMTALEDGRAVVAGGYGTRTAETYDPGAGAWSLTGPMTEERHDHTATLLHDGRVLVAGGSNCRSNCTDANSLRTAELFDPATNTWSPTGGMLSARMDHTAALLADGRVLVAGGIGIDPGETPAPDHRFTTLRSAEIYDPRSGTWSATPPMALARQRALGFADSHGDGFVVGGMTYAGDYRSDPHGTSALHRDTATSVERFEPAAAGWTPAAPLPDPGEMEVEAWGGVLQDGRFLRIDGWQKESAVLYDPVADRWDRLKVSGHGGEVDGSDGDNLHPNVPLLVLTDGRVLSSGGVLADSGAETWLFDPVTASWAPSGGMGLARYHHAAVQLTSGKVLVFGGEQRVEPNYIYAVGRDVVTSEVYDPRSGNWSPW
jgi:hypothetical protein